MRSLSMVNLLLLVCSFMRAMLTLTLSHGTGGRESFERSFDCSIFSNLEEVEFGIGWFCGSLFWIPMALSTLKPATPPHLFTIQLNFASWPLILSSTEAIIQEIANELRQVAVEIARTRW